MKAVAVLFSLVIFTLAGCSTSRPAVTEAPPAPEAPAAEPPEADDDARADDARADEEAPAALTAPEAPRDWFHYDAATDTLPGVGTERAYETLLEGREPQQTVVVAVIDGGVDDEHEDLQGQLWTNDDEIAGNDVDDDDNGYVDDIHGWNFIGGADGENVDHDTYELTRIYARLKAQYEDADPAALSPKEQEEYARYEEIRAQWTEQRQEMAQNLAQTQMLEEAYDRAQVMLKEHLDADTLTAEALRGVASPSQRMQQARAMLLYFAELGVTAQDIADQREYLESTLRYGYDLSFDPRTIVGDDYDDASERYYGNADVEGPDAGHGTHVAGIIGAARGNGLGVDGIAGAVEVMAVRAVPNGDERDKDVANAIRYAADNGADIINMSFGKSYSPQKAVVDAAVRHADSLGVLLIHAAGNDGKNVDASNNFPTPYYADSTGRAQNWITVGASSWSDGLVAPFSNYGAERVDVFAPGVDIYSTVPGQQYQRNSGTSMAAPVVAGVAALVMAHYPDLSATQVKEILLASAVSKRDVQVALPGGAEGEQVAFGTLSQAGGLVNAYRALEMAERVNGQ